MAESPIECEWDPDKAEANARKHGVTFTEAAHVFGDPRALTRYDDLHSDEEDRYLTLGLSAKAVVFLVCSTPRGDAVRIISARRATRRETYLYERRDF